MPHSRIAALSRDLTVPRPATWRAVAAGLLLHLAPATAAESAHRSEDCASTGGGGGSRQVEYRLDGSEGTASYRFLARFTGGHDDTVASLEAALDGGPDACGPGSKTYLVGEDGDVSLHCRIAPADRAGAPRVLRVVVRWSHAEFIGFEWLRE